MDEFITYTNPRRTLRNFDGHLLIAYTGELTCIPANAQTEAVAKKIRAGIHPTEFKEQLAHTHVNATTRLWLDHPNFPCGLGTIAYEIYARYLCYKDDQYMHMFDMIPEIKCARKHGQYAYLPRYIFYNDTGITTVEFLRFALTTYNLLPPVEMRGLCLLPEMKRAIDMERAHQRNYYAFLFESAKLPREIWQQIISYVIETKLKPRISELSNYIELPDKIILMHLNGNLYSMVVDVETTWGDIQDCAFANGFRVECWKHITERTQLVDFFTPNLHFILWQ